MCDLEPEVGEREYEEQQAVLSAIAAEEAEDEFFAMLNDFMDKSAIEQLKEVA